MIPSVLYTPAHRDHRPLSFLCLTNWCPLGMGQWLRVSSIQGANYAFASL